MEDAKYCGRDWIQTGNWPQVQYKPSYNRTTPGDLAQVLRCGSPHPNFGTSIRTFLHLACDLALLDMSRIWIRQLPLGIRICSIVYGNDKCSSYITVKYPHMTGEHGLLDLWLFLMHEYSLSFCMSFVAYVFIQLFPSYIWCAAVLAALFFCCVEVFQYCYPQSLSSADTQMRRVREFCHAHRHKLLISAAIAVVGGGVIVLLSTFFLFNLYIFDPL